MIRNSAIVLKKHGLILMSFDSAAGEYIVRIIFYKKIYCSIIILMLIDFIARTIFHYINGIGVYKIHNLYFILQVARDFKSMSSVYNFILGGFDIRIQLSIIQYLLPILLVNYFIKNMDVKYIIIFYFYCVLVAIVGNSIEHWLNGYVTNYIGVSTDGIYFNVYTLCDFIFYLGLYVPFLLLAIFFIKLLYDKFFKRGANTKIS